MNHAGRRGPRAGRPRDPGSVPGRGGRGSGGSGVEAGGPCPEASGRPSQRPALGCLRGGVRAPPGPLSPARLGVTWGRSRRRESICGEGGHGVTGRSLPHTLLVAPGPQEAEAGLRPSSDVHWRQMSALHRCPPPPPAYVTSHSVPQACLGVLGVGWLPLAPALPTNRRVPSHLYWLSSFLFKMWFDPIFFIFTPPPPPQFLTGSSLTTFQRFSHYFRNFTRSEGERKEAQKM